MYIRKFSRKPVLRRRQYYFSINAENGQVLASSEGYNNKADRNQTVWSIKQGTLMAEVFDEDDEKETNI